MGGRGIIMRRVELGDKKWWRGGGGGGGGG